MLLWQLRRWVAGSLRKSDHISPLDALGGSMDRAVLDLEDTEVWLRIQLRRYPYWRYGHLRLAETALVLDKVVTAYSSVLAANALACGEEDAEATALLGQCYLRRGNFHQAKIALERVEQLIASGKLQATKVLHWRIIEDLGAARLGLGDSAGALSILSRIPKEVQSAEVQTAMRFAQALAVKEKV